tara:strand:+ start:1251 stop:2015 length:765 start_codon:yes stop_codon:yes gene_type:complete
MSNKVEIAGYDEHSSHLRRREVGLYNGGLKVYEPTLTTIDESLNNLELIALRLETLVEETSVNNDLVSVSSAGGISVYADSNPAPTLDNDTRKGWLWEKTVVGLDKFNYYLYASTHSSHQFTMGDLTTTHFTGSHDNISVSNYTTFVIVYSKPTGVGDAGAFYHSRRTYSYPLSAKVVSGEQFNFYVGVKPVLPNKNRYIELSTVATAGDNLDTEEILFITLHTDTTSAVGTKTLISSAGYNMNDMDTRTINLV